MTKKTNKKLSDKKVQPTGGLFADLPPFKDLCCDQDLIEYKQEVPVLGKFILEVRFTE